MKKIVFFDIDGTLVSKQNYVPESTKRAIQELKKNGILPVIATGRSPLLLEEVREKLDIDSYISMNGQFVVLNGKVLYENPLSKDTVERFVETAVKRQNGVMLCGSQDIFSNSLVSLAKRSSVWKVMKGIGRLIPGRIQLSLFKRAMKKPPKPEEYADKEIYQIILEAPTGQEADYVDEFEEFSFTRSNDYTMDVIARGVSKATGIERFIKELGVRQEDTYAFGDSLNDVEMMKYVGTGVAMGNGLPEVKAAADMVTDHVSEDGIEKGLKKLGLI
jgi:hypothetical protein